MPLSLHVQAVAEKLLARLAGQHSELQAQHCELQAVSKQAREQQAQWEAWRTRDEELVHGLGRELLNAYQQVSGRASLRQFGEPRVCTERRRHISVPSLKTSHIVCQITP